MGALESIGWSIIIALIWSGAIGSSAIIAFLAGVILAVLFDDAMPILMLRSILVGAVARFRCRREARSDTFDMQHTLLNIEPDAVSSWVNLGYWPDHTETGESDSRVDHDSGSVGADPTSYVSACRGLARLLCDFSGVSASSRVLDVGCGCGDSSFFLLEEYDCAAIEAINIAKTQIQWAKRRAEKRKRQQKGKHAYGESRIDRIRFQVASATEIHAELFTSPDSPAAGVSPGFSHILALDCAYHFDSREEFFRRSFELVAPGGTIALMDIIPILPADAETNGLTIGWRLGMRIVSAACGIPIANLYSLSTYRRHLTAAGFTSIEVVHLPARSTFAGFAAFIQRHGQVTGTAASISADHRPSSWFRPSAFTRYRVTASVLEWMGRKRVAEFILIRATKPKTSAG